jgi:uncharacterized protein
MDITETIANELKINIKQVISTIELLDAGNTLPFIARYRKEATGELDEEQIRLIDNLVDKLRILEERKETVLRTIEEQGRLTDELKDKILSTKKMSELEDIYLPFKPKRRTRAMIARERGLEGLAMMIINQTSDGTSPELVAKEYLSEEVPSIPDALSGARDIVAEMINENSSIRHQIREKAMKWGNRREKGLSSIL